MKNNENCFGAPLLDFLCFLIRNPIENHPEKLLGSVQTNVYITVSTSSTKNVSFTIRLYKQEIFQIKDFNQSVSAMASPSAPIFFQVNLKEEEAALVKFESKDGICAILSVQNVTCPVFDLDRNVKFEGLYQTVDTYVLWKKNFLLHKSDTCFAFFSLTGITYTQDQYPVGIYLGLFTFLLKNVSCLFCILKF